MWDKTYSFSGSSNEFDGIRMIIIGSDGYIYASGLLRRTGGTIFIVYAGQSLYENDPSDGEEIWTDINEL